VTVGSAWQDAAGNAGVGGSDTVTIDTLNPNAPTVLLAEDNVGADTGNLSSGATTDDSKPVLRVGLTGTNAETGDSVRIFSGTSALITALISANDLNNQYVSVTLPELSDDAYNFTATIVDAAGNESAPSDTFTLNIEANNGEPPTAILLSNSSVLENRADAFVANLSALDPDSGDSFTFSLSDDAGGRFVIVGNTLRTTGPLDFEDHQSWNIEVQVSDSSNNNFLETFQIDVGDVNGFTIKGSQGNDVISATKTVAGQHKATGEEDTILGRGGNDKIDGAGGNDTIRGGAGNDKIIGGLGVDQLFGNAGADQFIFKSVADSLADNADTINGFSHSQHDKIDLRGVAADALGAGQHFTFIGGAVFGSHAGELRYDSAADLVQVDTDGNGTADFAIHVAVAIDLVRGDFLL
jgi:Ca2+-binding RTX toxin-like protein